MFCFLGGRLELRFNLGSSMQFNVFNQVLYLMISMLSGFHLGWLKCFRIFIQKDQFRVNEFQTDSRQVI